MKKLFILVGLPGSGKTYFANYQESALWKTVKHVELDKYKDDNKNIDEILTSIKFDSETTIIDGLILTTNDIIHLLDTIGTDGIDEIQIHYWIPDRDICLWNDKGRREISSCETIKNAYIEEPNIAEISKKYPRDNICLVKHTVIKKPFWKHKKQYQDLKIVLKDGKYLYSESWSLGGTYCNCWGNTGRCLPDPQPTSFKDFDKLLETICPDISFLKYKKLYEASVSIATKVENDYYGGSVEYAFYQCDIDELLSMLIEMEIWR